MKRWATALIRAYQAISRTTVVQSIFLNWSGCRLWPTCSDYAIDMIQQYGVLRGGARALMRTAHCNPLTPAFTHIHD